MKDSRKVYTFIFALLLLIFAIFSVIGWVQVSKHAINKNIVENGTELQAEVVEYKSNIKLDGTKYYYVTYSYYYGGKKYTEKSSTSYTLEQVKDLEQITIKYYNGKTIEAGYTKDKRYNMMFTFSIIFTCATVGFLVAIIVNLSQSRELNNIKKSGTRTVGMFKASSVNAFVKGEPRYKIECVFRDNLGNVRQEFSLGQCDEKLRDYLKKLNNIEIAFDDKHCVIVEDMSKEKRHENTNPEKEDTEYYECDSCLSIVKPSKDGVCPNCGNYIREYIIKNKK